MDIYRESVIHKSSKRGLWRKIPYSLSDIPFLILLAGTFAFGKGFSTLRLQVGGIPLFITELTLLMSIFLISLKGRIINVFKRIPNSLKFVFFVYMGLGLMYLFFGFQKEGMVAFRDIVFCIYPLFLFITLLTFHNSNRLRAIFFLIVPISFITILIGFNKLFDIFSGFGSVNEFLSQIKGFNLTLYYSFVLIFCITFFAFAEKRRFLLSSLLLLSISLIIFLRIRTAWVASVVGISFLIIISRTYILKLSRIFPVLLVGIIFISYAVQTSTPRVGKEIVLKAKTIYHWETPHRYAGNVRWRIEVWKQTLRYALESPVTGKGFGVQPDFIIKGKVFRYPKGVLPGLEAHSPHNHILTIFYKMGLAGLFLFLFINLKIFFYGLHYIKKCNFGFNRCFLVACLASFVCWHTTAFFFDVIESPPTSIFLWIILGLILSVIYIDKNENSIRSQPVSAVRR